MKQYFYSLFLLFSLMVLPGFLLGQRTVSGKITDSETGEALLGATIQVVGTTSGAVSGLDGSYTVRIPDGGTQIRFSYSGYTEQVIDLTAANVLDVALKPGQLLSELVVIGYGSVKKEDLTGSVVKVGTTEFNKGAISAPQELVVGKIAGVAVTPGAAPGEGASIRIRGGSSLSATNDPLIVVDGVPIDNGTPSGSRNSLNVVNPADIESFTVLKDASATAIYGSRASNGVIMITTKKGALKEKLGVSYSGNVSFSKRLNEVDVLSGDEFRALINERFADDATTLALLGDANTDWQSEIYQTGIGTDHNLSVHGSAGILPYRVSLGFNDRSGILKTDQFERYSGAISLNPGFFDNKLQVTWNLREVVERNRFANRGAIGSAMQFDPTKPVYSTDATDISNYGGYWTWKQQNGDPNPRATSNPVAQLEQRFDRSSTDRLITNLQLDYRFWFLPDLRANLNLGYDRFKTGTGSVYEPTNYAGSYVNGGLDQRYAQTRKNSLLDFYLNYVKKIGRSNLDIMGGYSWQHFYRENYDYSTNVDQTIINTEEDVFKRELYLLSLFGRVNFNLADKVLLTGTLRRDGTSRFAPENRWGLFPAAAVAWKIMDNKSGIVNNLKLRVGYGVTGQQGVDEDNYYNYLATYLSGTGTAQYQFDNSFYTTLRPNGYDKNIKWEETATTNFALDYELLDSRIFGTVEYYIRKTTDLINYITVPAGSNLTNAIYTNIGNLENKGVEISLNLVPVKTAKTRWEIGGNVTLNKNKITKLTARDDPSYLGVETGGIAGGVGNNIQIHSVGYSANSFYVYEQVYDESGKPIEGLYVDRNGDGKVSPADRYRYNSSAPTTMIGFYTNFNYGKFDLSLGARANIGNYVYNNIQSDVAYYNRLNNNNFGNLNNVQRDVFDIGFDGSSGSEWYFSDYYVQNASFLRFDHVTLGYNFAQMGKIKGLRIYATVQNPLLVTKYTGLDPEVFSGIDNNVYPRSRTFVFGVNADF